MMKGRQQKAAVSRKGPGSAVFYFLIGAVLFISTAFAQEIGRDAGQVAIIEYPGTASYDTLLPDGSPNYSSRQSVSRQFYGTHGDHYDFLYIFTNFDYALREKEAQGQHWGVRNVIQGIGLPLNDASSLFGSKGRLQGLIDLGNIERVVSDPTSPLFGRTLAIIAHETAHQWGSYISYVNEGGARSRALIGQDNTHWSFLLDSNASVMYGASWQDNKNGTFTAADIMERYSPLDLYLMGFLLPPEVPPFLLIRNPTIDPAQLPQKDITIAGVPLTITIDQVIAAEGPRVPDASSSQKEFRGAFVLLTANGLEPTLQQIQAVDTIRKQWSQEFFILTKGRAVIETTLVEVPTGPFAVPPQVMKGLTWLSTQMDPEGSWADTPFTDVRESSEAVTTLFPYPKFASNVSTGLSWLSRAPPSNVDFLSRRLTTLSLAHQQDLPGVGDLFQRKNTENGFGLSADYLSDPLDTALALLALKEGTRLQDLLPVVQRLHSLQNPDGGWGSHFTGPSQIAPTSLSLYALYLFKGVIPVDDLIAKGMGWLLSQQSPDGHIGRTDESALSLLSIVQKDHNRYHTQIQSAAEALMREQNTDFSWNQSVYDTALTVRAISQALYSNLYFTSTDLTLSSTQPFEGEKVIVTAHVHNGGSYPANSVLVRFFDGDPFQGGTQIGVDQTIPTISPQGSVSVQAIWDTTSLSGDHIVVAQVDPLDTIPEPDETDNQEVVNASIRPRPPLAELSITTAEIAIYPDPIFVLPIDVTINALVHNLGSVDAPVVEVAFYDGSQSPQNLLGSTIIPLVSSRGGMALASFVTTVNAPGGHTILVVVDPNNLIPELDKTNNAASKTLSILPTIDLEIRSEEIIVSRSIINIGEHLTVSALVRNRGTQPAKDIEVAFYVDSSDKHELMGVTRIPIIYGGSSWYANLDWLSEVSGTPVSISVVADPFGKIPLDVNRDNNTGFTEVTILLSTLANLRTKPEWITVSSDPGLQGSSLTVSAIAENNGFDSANNIIVSLYTAHPDAGGTLIDTQVIPSLAPSQQAIVTFQWASIPVHGDIPLTVIIDPQNQIAEFTKEDNMATRLLHVLSLPDLALSDADISFTPSFPSPGVTLTVTAAIHNLGDQGVGSFSVQLLYDGVPVAETTGISISGTGLTTQNFTIQSGSEGTHTISVILDPENAVAELSKANNSATKALQVQSADIYVSEPYFSPNGDGVKDTTAIFFRTSGVATVAIRSLDGDIVRTFTEATSPVVWDGLTEDHILAPDGSYTFQVPSGISVQSKMVVLDTNRSSLVEAAGTPLLRKKDITCPGNVTIYETLWTPDGERVLFEPSVNNIDGLYSMKPDGTDIKNLTEGITFPPAFYHDYSPKDITISRDGTTLAFDSIFGGTRVWVGRADGTGWRAVATGRYPRLSPDGRKVLYSNGDLLRMRNLEDSSDFSISPVAYSPSYSWSPDGKRIAYSKPNPMYGDSDLWFSNPDGTGAKMLYPECEVYAWSPTGDKIASIGRDRVSDDGRLRIFSSLGEVLKEIHIVWPSYGGFLQWFPDGRRLAFANPGNYDSGIEGIDIYDFKTDQVSRIFDNPTFFPEVSSDGRYIIYFTGWAAESTGVFAKDIKTGKTIFFSPLNNPGAQDFFSYNYYGGANYIYNNELPLHFSPTGEFFIYADYPGCGHWQPLFVLSSLENLTAELHASRPPGASGLILTGTASDKNFESYVLEYASTLSPGTWFSIGLPSSLQIIDDVLGNWIPPGPGTFLVRLTVRDKAGNERNTTIKVPWAEQPAITNVVVSPQYISPNGDGIQDTTTLSFLALQPGTLEFQIFSSDGRLVQSVTHTTLEAGAQDNIIWDGRGFDGNVVTDGRYAIKVSGLIFYVTVDTTPPDVSLIYGVIPGGTIISDNTFLVSTFVLWCPTGSRNDNEYTTARTILGGHVLDNNLAEWLLRDMTSGAILTKGSTEMYPFQTDDAGNPLIDPATGRPVKLVENGKVGDTPLIDRDVPSLAATRERHQLEARDLAGNKNHIELPAFQEGVFIVSVDPDISRPLYGDPCLKSERLIELYGQKFNCLYPKHVFRIGTSISSPIGSYALEYFSGGTWVETPLSFVDGPTGMDLYAPALGYTWLYWDPSVLSGVNIPNFSDVSFRVRAEDTSGRIFYSLPRIFSITTSCGEKAKKEESVPSLGLSVSNAPATQCGMDPGSLFSLTASYKPGLTLTTVFVPGRTAFTSVTWFYHELGPPGTVLYYNYAPIEKVSFSAQLVPNGPWTEVGSLEHGGELVTQQTQFTISWNTISLPQANYPVRVEMISSDEGAFLTATSVVDKKPPEASIEYPLNGQIVCPILSRDSSGVLSLTVPIQGRASDEFLTRYELSYLRSGLWVPFATGNQSRAGVLGDWNVSSLPQDDYSIQLQVRDAGGFLSCVETQVFLNQPGQIGSASVYPTLFSPNLDGVLDSTLLTYTISNQSLVTLRILDPQGGVVRTLLQDFPQAAGSQQVSWDGRDDFGSVLPDGWYVPEITMKDLCGNTQKTDLAVEVDDTPPIAKISSPRMGSSVGLMVPITGTATDLHFAGYSLSVGAGTSPIEWSLISSADKPVSEGFLGLWNTFGLSGSWTMKLTVSDLAGNVSSDQVIVFIPSRTDIVSALNADPALFSPNGDLKLDTSNITFTLTTASSVTLAVLDPNGVPVRKALDAVQRPVGATTFTWDGRSDSGSSVPDGFYTADLTAVAGSGLTQSVEIPLEVDTTPPLVIPDIPQAGAVFSPPLFAKGTIMDKNIASYTVSVTGSGITPVILSQGAQSRIGEILGVIQGLDDGTYGLTFSAVDRAANEAHLTVPFTVDTVAPVVTISSPRPMEMVGQARESLSISASIAEKNLAGYTVSVGAGLTPSTWETIATGIQPPETGPLATWPLTGRPDGLYSILVSATDRAGFSGSAQVSIVLDRTPPIALISSPSSGSLILGPTDILGTASDENFRYYSLELAAGDSTTAYAWGTLFSSPTPMTDAILFHWEPLLSNGPYVFRLTVKDQAGNTAIAIVPVQVILLPPEPPQDLAATAITSDVLLTWFPVPDPHVTGYNVYRFSSKITAAPVTVPTYIDVGLRDGLYSYTVTSVNLAGLESDPSNTASALVDTTPPLVSISMPGDGARIHGTVDIIGTAWSLDDFKEYHLLAGGVLLRSSPAPVRNDILGTWDTTGTPEGTSVTIAVTAEDIRGNIGTAQIIVTVDNQPPAPPDLLSAVPSGNTVSLTWAPPPDSDLRGIILFRNQQQINEAPFTQTSYTDTGLSDGTYAYFAIAEDQAGNWSLPSNTREATIETRPPHAVIIEPSEGERIAHSLLVRAQSPDLDIATVLFQFQSISSLEWTDIGADTGAPFEAFWDVGGLPYGQYRLRAIATDTHGNTDPTPGFITVTWGKPPQGLTAQVMGDTVFLIWAVDPAASGSYIYRDGRRLTPVPKQGNSFIDPGLPDGLYTYTATTVSAEGSESAQAGPTPAKVYAPVVLEPFHLITTTTLDLRGIRAAAEAAVDIFKDGTFSHRVPAASSGAFSLTTQLAAGLNTFTAVATDAQGNVSKPSLPAYFTLASAPATPMGFTGTATNFDVLLTWDPNIEPDLAGYTLSRDGAALNSVREIAAGGTATASSVYSYCDPYWCWSARPELAIDGDQRSAWQSKEFIGGFEPTWWELDFTQTTLIQRIEIDWLQDWQGKDYDIQAWDGSRWITTSRAIDNASLQVSHPVGFTTDKVRILIYGLAASQTFVSISEVRVYAHDPLTQTAYTDSSLTNGFHTYALRAISRFGLESGPTSLSVPVGDVTPPSPPLNLTASVLGRDVTLSWIPSPDPDVAGYNLYRDGNLINPGLNIAHEGAASASERDWNAQDAIDGDPWSCWYTSLRWRDFATVWWMVTLPSPQKIDRMSVQWDPWATPSTYRLEAWNGSSWVLQPPDTGPSFPTDRVRITVDLNYDQPEICLSEVELFQLQPLPAPPYVDLNLPNGLYTYVVKAIDQAGNTSAPSNEAKALIAVPPSPPDFYDPAPGGQTVTVAYNPIGIYGNAEPANNVTLYWFSMPILVAQADSFGKFVFSAIFLMPGANIFTATATDSFSLVSEPSLPLTIIFDNQNLPDLLFTDLFLYPPVPISGQKAGLTATVKNGGVTDASTVPVRFYRKDPSGGLTPIGAEQVIPVLSPGASAQVSVFWDTQGLIGDFTLMAVIDPLFQVPEQREDNNTIEKIVTIAPDTNPVLTASTDHLSYSADETLTTHVTLVNPGSPKDIDLSVTIEDAGGFTVTTLFSQLLTGVQYGERRDFSLPWNTGKTFAGGYTLVARAGTQGIQLSEARSTFSILPSYRATSLLTSDKVSYRPHEDVALKGTITNTSPNTPITGAEAVLEVFDPQGTSLVTQIFSLPQLPVGAGQVVKALWPVDLAPPGLYQAELDVTLSGTLLTSSIVEFSVKAEVLVVGNIQASPRTVGIGATTTVSLLVSNQGNAPADPLPVFVELRGPGLVSPVISFTTSTSLPAGSSVTESFALSSSGLMTGDYVLYEKALTGGGEKTLATGPVFIRDLTPPVLAASSPSPGTYLNQALLILAQAGDTGLGVAYVSYAIDQGPSIPLPLISGDPWVGSYGTFLPLGPADEGNHLLELVAFDLAGNTSPILGISYTVDITPPLIIVTGVEEGRDYWFSATPVIDIYDAHLDHSSILLNGVPFTSGQTITDQGSYTLVVTASDKAGNASSKIVTFRVLRDITPPVSVLTVGDPRFSDGTRLFVSPATLFILTATDDMSGVVKTEYSVDSSEYREYTAPFSLPTEGDHTISYRSIDGVGNVEAAKTLSVIVDATAPVTVISFSTPVPPTQPYPVFPWTVVTLTATDSLSGVASTVYRFDSSPYQAYTGPISLSSLPLGAHTISYKSTDHLGHEEAVHTVTLDLQGAVNAKVDMGRVLVGRVLVYLHCAKHKEEDSVSLSASGGEGGGEVEGEGEDGDDDHTPSCDPAAWKTWVDALFFGSEAYYRLVETPEDFAREFRSGGYTEYLLLAISEGRLFGGEDDKEKDDDCGDKKAPPPVLDKELREAINRGDGIVIVKPTPSEEPYLREIYGAKIDGQITSKNGMVLTLTTSALGITGPVSLTGTSIAVRVEPTTGQALGFLSVPDKKDKDIRYPGVVLNLYGQGKSLLFPFDVSRGATSTDYLSLLTLLTRALAYVQPMTPATLLPLDIVGIGTTVTSLDAGMTVSVDETVSLPLTIYAPLDQGQVTGTHITWGASLLPDETRTFRALLRLPDQVGTFTTTSEVFVLSGGGWVPAGSGLVSLTLTQTSEILRQQLETDLKSVISLSPCGKHSKSLSASGGEGPGEVDCEDKEHLSKALKAIEALENITGTTRKDADKGIHLILTSIKDLMKITSRDIGALRREEDILLKLWEERWWLVKS